jgi:VanZ family protein
VTDRARAAALAVLAAAWAGLIFWVSSQPHPFPFVPAGLFSHDKLLHAAAYALLGGLVRGALGSTRLEPSVASALAVAVAAVYGATDEWHQRFVPNRMPEGADLLADAIGAALGVAAAALVLRRRGARASIRA